MTKQCETFEHTADVGLLAEADTLAELYEALGEGLAELVCPRQFVRADETFELNVTSEDAELLAVDFLAELLTLIHVERVCIRGVVVHYDKGARLHAVVSGERMDPSRHELGEEIKAVTYHMLQVRCSDDRWTGRVLLDL